MLLPSMQRINYGLLGDGPAPDSDTEDFKIPIYGGGGEFSAGSSLQELGLNIDNG